MKKLMSLISLSMITVFSLQCIVESPVEVATTKPAVVSAKISPLETPALYYTPKAIPISPLANPALYLTENPKLEAKVLSNSAFCEIYPWNIRCNPAASFVHLPGDTQNVISLLA